MTSIHWCLAVVVALAGCSTTQETTAVKRSSSQIKVVSQVAEDGNSPAMDANLMQALGSRGIQVKSMLPKGTTTAEGSDALISYVDVWRWDIVMYLQSLTVKVTDAKTGDLLSIGVWRDSALHGFRDAKEVVRSVVGDAIDKASQPGP